MLRLLLYIIIFGLLAMMILYTHNIIVQSGLKGTDSSLMQPYTLKYHECTLEKALEGLLQEGD